MYQALYRKWRPKVFADVVGQEHITSTLMNEITSGRHSHAYLFTGSRGTGKTTCAKIFAKAVNCEHPVNGDPCNECETCKGIDNGQIMDIVEIDAASNNGVDNIRDLISETNFTPVSGKYRVYIIDEVHMLSTGAFNALLKTLEEPPKHVKFVLATTEIHKMPATILSRCQRFDFKRITPEGIAGRLLYVADQEGLTLEKDAAVLIARLADGALRDALSILDQCISHSKNITVDTVNETVGLAGKEYLFSLGNALLNKDTSSALDAINNLHNNSCDMERLCNELINHFRNLMICRAVKDPQNLIVCSEPELNEYKAISQNHKMTEILYILNVMGDTVNNLRKGLNRRIEMEMAIIKICSGNTSTAQSTQTTQVTPTAQVLSVPQATPIPQPALTAPPIPIPVVEPATQQVQVTQEPQKSEHVSLTEALPDGEIPTNIWNALIREVTMNDKILIGTLNTAKAYKSGETLNICTDNVLLKHHITVEQHRQAIYNATFTVLGEYLKPRISEEAPAVSKEAPPVSEPKQQADPLMAFINGVSKLNDSNQLDFNLYIEE